VYARARILESHAPLRRFPPVSLGVAPPRASSPQLSESPVCCGRLVFVRLDDLVLWETRRTDDGDGCLHVGFFSVLLGI